MATLTTELRSAGLALLTLVAALTLALVAAGCGEDESAAPGDDDSPSSQQSPGDLWGRSFISTAVTEDGEPRSLVAAIDLTFGQKDQAKAKFKAGCNVFGADVEVAADHLLVGRIVGTAVGCSGDLEKQDRWLTDFLGSDPQWQLSDDLLTLTSGDTLVEMEEERAVSSCREGIPADPQWRRRSSVTGPFGFYGPGRDFRHLARRGDRFVTKLPAIAARGEVVTLRVPSREQGSVALGYLGVGGHVEQVTFEACADRPATAWPGELVLADRRPVTLIVEVEGEPRVPVRVGRL